MQFTPAPGDGHPLGACATHLTSPARTEAGSALEEAPRGRDATLWPWEQWGRNLGLAACHLAVTRPRLSTPHPLSPTSPHYPTLLLHADAFHFVLDVLGDGTPHNTGSGATSTGGALLDTTFMYDDLLPLPFDNPGAMQGGDISAMGHSMRMPSSAPSPAWAAVPNPLLPGAGMGVPRRMTRMQQEPWAGPYPLASTVLAPGMVPRCARCNAVLPSCGLSPQHAILHSPFLSHSPSPPFSLCVQQAPQASCATGHQACDGVPSRGHHAG